MDLTRRGLLGRAAAASGLLLGGSLLGPRTVFAGDRGEAVFDLRLPRGSAARDGWHSGVVATPRRFELLGVEAREHGIAVRALDRDGRWSDWHELPAHSHGPGTVSDPVWVGPSRAFELRAPRSLHGVRAILVDGGSAPATTAATRYVRTDLPAGPGQPSIIARSSWATAACRPRYPAGLGQVELAFVHHTVSANGYRASQSAAIVRSICLFHKYGNGWNDIGYNFAVDRYGQVFEARAGGVDEAVVGAQAGGYNLVSSGVALIGTFSYSPPTRRTFDALADLLAWKLALHSIELPGTVTVEVSESGQYYSRYRAGTRVRLNRVSGHRDADATACPGSAMYRQLPRLRQTVAGRIGDVSSLTAQAGAAAPGAIAVAGVLSNAEGPIAGAAIEVQQRSTSSAAATFASAITAADGSWSVLVQVGSGTPLRALYRGDDSHSAVVSAGFYAFVPPQITLTAEAPQTSPGGVITFTGTTSPAKPKVTIAMALQQPDGSYATVRNVRVNTGEDGSFERTLGFPDAGEYAVVAHTGADDENALGTSNSVPVSVA